MPDRSDSAAKIDCLEGTITSIRPLRNGTAMQVTLNRRVRVVVPHGVSQFFAGLRVRITGAWCHGARRRYYLAPAVEPLESYTDIGVERLSQLLLGIPEAVGDRLAVLELLAPALTWLVSSGFHSVARRLARYTIRRALLVAHNPYSLIRRRELSFDAAEILYRRLHGDPVALPRLQAGTTEVLREAERKGRARLTREELATLVTARLDLPTTVEVVWSEVWKASIVARDGDLYCLPSWYHQRRRAMQTLRNNQMTIESAGGGSAGPLLSHRYTVLTGSARSGKTSLVRELVSACRAAGWRVAARP